VRITAPALIGALTALHLLSAGSAPAGRRLRLRTASRSTGDRQWCRIAPECQTFHRERKFRGSMTTMRRMDGMIVRTFCSSSMAWLTPFSERRFLERFASAAVR